MSCPSCGERNPRLAPKCAKCDSLLGQPGSTMIPCPSCGTHNPRFAVHCSKCIMPMGQGVVQLSPSLDGNSSSMMLASTGQRFGNMLLDFIFSIVFSLIVGFILGIILVLFGSGDAIYIQGVYGYLFSAILTFLYYFPQEAFSGRTLGKLITGTKVVNEDGTKLTFGRAFGRTLCRFIPFEAFSFLGGDGRPLGWHDRIPKTQVVSVR